VENLYIGLKADELKEVIMNQLNSHISALEAADEACQAIYIKDTAGSISPSIYEMKRQIRLNIQSRLNIMTEIVAYLETKEEEFTAIDTNSFIF